MAKLKFVQLLVLSRQTKSSNLFTFSPTKNLITADDNGRGKSTLVQSLLWTLGCDFNFGETWKAAGVSCLLEFTIDDKTHEIYRDEHGICYQSGEHRQKFSKITGAYSKFFAELVSFDLLLLNHNKELEIPPPAYYFLPFYVSQSNGWNEAWSGFEKLTQFPKYKNNTAKYHTGYLDKRYFDLEKQIKKMEVAKNESEENIGRLNTTVATINDLLKINQMHSFGYKLDNIDSIENELKVSLDDLLKKESDWAKQLSLLQSDRYFLQQQLNYLELAIHEFESDYVFATENLEDEITCPTCGVLHDNSIISRASILDDKSHLEAEKIQVQNLLDAQSEKIDELNNQLASIKVEISVINKKYGLEEDGLLSLDGYIQNIAPDMIKERVNVAKVEQETKIGEYEIAKKELKKEQRGLLSKQDKDSLAERFLSLFREIKIKLNLRKINTKDIKSALNYAKLKTVDGGEAEKTRILLAYRLAVYEIIKSRKNAVISPLIIDTPFQQDQDPENYKVIMEYLANELDSDAQVFVCAMHNEIVEIYGKQAQVIKLDNEKILKKGLFNNHENIVNNFLSNFES